MVLFNMSKKRKILSVIEYEDKDLSAIAYTEEEGFRFTDDEGTDRPLIEVDLIEHEVTMEELQKRLEEYHLK